MRDGRCIPIGGEEPGTSEDQSHCVREFRLENGLPIWTCEAEGFVIEKRLLLIHGQNTLHAIWRILSGPGSVRLELCPSVHFLGHERDVGEPLGEGCAMFIRECRYEISTPELPPPPWMTTYGERAHFTHEGGRVQEIKYEHEAARAYPSHGVLWSPGFFHFALTLERAATPVASPEDWPTILALAPATALASDIERRVRLISAAHPSAQSGPAAEPVLAADQFLIQPAGRVEDAARAKAAGDDVRTVIAGYH